MKDREIKMTNEEKKIKALEIINEKNVNIKFVKVASNLENYNYFINITTNKKEYELNQEEYDLLKEVLLYLIYVK